MTLPNPKFAPRRGDLPWLRRRRRPAVVADARPTTAGSTTTAASSPPPSGGRIDYTKHRPSKAPDVTPRPTAPTPPRPTPAQPAAATAASSSAAANPLDLSGPTTPPAGGNPLDLSAPISPAPTRPAPTRPAADTSLDLGGSSATSLDLGGAPAPAPTPTPTSSTSLDLGAGPTPTGGPPRRPAPPPTPARHHVVRRTRRGATTLLDFTSPVVTLTPLQSGIGTLTFDAVVGDGVGDLHLGAAWELTDGRTGTVDLVAGRKLGPDGRHAVVWAGRQGRFERIALDLRQSRSLARLLLFGFSPTKATLQWGGTVVATTAGGERIDAPIVSAPSPAVVALVSLYNVDGEFVVRAEMDPVAGSVRDTCRAFGYDRITWLDDRTPVG